MINGGIIPTEEICRRIDALGMGEALLYEGELVAARLNGAQFETLIDDEEVRELQGKELESTISVTRIEHLWQLTRLNATAILDDYQLITSGRKSQPVSPTNRLIGPTQNVFLEEGVQMEC